MPMGTLTKVYTGRRSYAPRPRFRTKKQFTDNRKATRKYVKRMIDRSVEVKYSQGENPYIDVSQAGTAVIQLNDLAQGVDDGQRVGDQVTCRKLDLRLSMVNATGNFQRVRAILFWYRMQVPGVTITAADILAVNSVVGAGTPISIISSYNLRNKGAYQILWDKTFTLTSVNNANPTVTGSIQGVGGVPVQTYRKIKNLKKKIAQWNGPAIGNSITKGFLGLLFVSDIPNTASVAQKPQVAYHYTFTYGDG